MRCLILLSMLLASPAARGQVFDLVLPARFALDPPAPAADGELLVELNAVRAAHGVRPAEGQGAFRDALVLEPGAQYVVRDGKGALHRLYVASRPGAQSRVELLQLGGAPATRPAAALVGRYQNSRVQVDGLEASSTFSDIELHEDGRYRVGTSTGRWTWAQGQLSLEGAWAHWGSARVDPAGKVVHFEFQRGRWRFEVTFSRAEPPASPPQLADAVARPE